jgi:hypothetical protein
MFRSGKVESNITAITPPRADDVTAAPALLDAMVSGGADLGNDSPMQATNLAPLLDPARPEDPQSEGGHGLDATLRVEKDADLVRISAVKVEASPMFAHLYPDGRVIIDDYERDDDDD